MCGGCCASDGKERSHNRQYSETQRGQWDRIYPLCGGRFLGRRHVAIDDKTLRRSFDNFLDRRAAHILSAFASDTALVLCTSRLR